MKKGRKSERGSQEAVIPLKDLVPRQDPKGGKAGSRKTVFGGGPVIDSPQDADSPARKGHKVK